MTLLAWGKQLLWVFFKVLFGPLLMNDRILFISEAFLGNHTDDENLYNTKKNLNFGFSFLCNHFTLQYIILNYISHKVTKLKVV